MARIRVIIVDHLGSFQRQVELPDDVPMSRIVPALVTKFNFSMTSTDGQPIQYKLDHEKSGNRLGDEETLSDAGVEAEDRLMLMPEPIAGALAT